MTKTCVQCGKAFEIGEREKEYCRSNHLPIPDACGSCRRRSRIRKRDVVVPRRYLGLFPKRSNRKAMGSIGMVFHGKYLLWSLVALLVFSQAISHRMRENYTPLGTNVNNDAGNFAAGSTATGGTVLSDTLIFRNFDLLQEHFEKHGQEMGYKSTEEYLAAANAVVADPSVLHKKQAEDGDDVYFLQKTNDLVIVSTDGYIRTYFRPEDGIEYFDKQ